MKALTRKSHKICAAFAFIAAICVFAILFYFALAHGVSLSASDALSRSAKWSFKSEAAISQELNNEFSKIQNSSAKVDGFVWSGDDGLEMLNDKNRERYLMMRKSDRQFILCHGCRRRFVVQSYLGIYLVKVDILR